MKSIKDLKEWQSLSEVDNLENFRKFILKYDPEGGFVQSKKVLLEIYSFKLEYAENVGNYHIDGLKETVTAMREAGEEEFRVCDIDLVDGSCYIFSNKESSRLIGVVFYPKEAY